MPQNGDSVFLSKGGALTDLALNTLFPLVRQNQNLGSENSLEKASQHSQNSFEKYLVQGKSPLKKIFNLHIL